MSFNKNALFGAAVAKKTGVCRIGNEKEFYPIDPTAEQAVLDQQIKEAAKHFTVLTEAQPVGELSFAVIKKLDDTIDANSGEKKEKELHKQSLEESIILAGSFSSDEAKKMAKEVVDDGDSLEVVKQRHTPEKLVFVVGDKAYETTEEVEKADVDGKEVKVAIRRGDVTIKEMVIPSAFSTTFSQAVPVMTGESRLDSLMKKLPNGSIDAEFDVSGNPTYRVLYRKDVKESKRKPMTREKVKKLIEGDDCLDEGDFAYYPVNWKMDKDGNLVCYPDVSATPKPFKL